METLLAWLSAICPRKANNESEGNLCPVDGDFERVGIFEGFRVHRTFDDVFRCGEQFGISFPFRADRALQDESEDRGGHQEAFQVETAAY